jgi:hypothetical protein
VRLKLVTNETEEKEEIPHLVLVLYTGIFNPSLVHDKDFQISLSLQNKLNRLVHI